MTKPGAYHGNTMATNGGDFEDDERGRTSCAMATILNFLEHTAGSGIDTATKDERTGIPDKATTTSTAPQDYVADAHLVRADAEQLIADATRCTRRRIRRRSARTSGHRRAAA